LHHSIPIEDIYKYFADPTHTGFEILSDKELEKHTFKKIYKRKGKITTESMTWKNISNKEKENMEKDMKHHEQTKDR
jgi:geranylgeranyl pyrophosphate synthase